MCLFVYDAFMHSISPISTALQHYCSDVSDTRACTQNNIHTYLHTHARTNSNECTQTRKHSNASTIQHGRDPRTVPWSATTRPRHRLIRSRLHSVDTWWKRQIQKQFTSLFEGVGAHKRAEPKTLVVDFADRQRFGSDLLLERWNLYLFMVP
eukprot:m.657290 g.657290  ORF g.657290 m.657290 type:complete len:152 (-) comp22712_c0_seq4:122-577(-)